MPGPLSQTPLNALRSFEAAARCLSFNDAAKELGVTPSAVSLQVRRLEDRIGRSLFVRNHRSVELSETGKRLAPRLTAVFTDLDRLLSEVIEPATTSLRISTMPSFAARWLAPRLASFVERYPQYRVRIAGEDSLAGFVRDDLDIGIRYGSGDYPDLYCEKIADAFAFPVCSSAFAARHADALATPAGLISLPLLHDEIGEAAPGLPTWRSWLDHAGASLEADVRGPRFESLHMALASAEAGQGIALGLTPLVDDALASGALIQPFAIAVPSVHAFWLVCRSDRARERKLAAFRRWVRSEMTEAGASSENP